MSECYVDGLTRRSERSFPNASVVEHRWSPGVPGRVGRALEQPALVTDVNLL